MSELPPSPNGVVHPSVNYEPSDLSLRAVLTFSAGLVVALLVIVGGLFLLAWAFVGAPAAPEPVESWGFKGEPGPNPQSSRLPAKPELEAIDQNTPTAKDGPAVARPIREQVREEEDRLNGYGWVNEDKGIVYIPIARAMERLGGKPAAPVAHSPAGGAP